MDDTTAAAPPGVLHFDLDDLDVGEITFLELTLNQKLREFLPDSEIITFNDVVAQFSPKAREALGAAGVKCPTGLILQTVGLLQLRRDNPAATWEDAGKLKVEVEAPKADIDPTAFIRSADAAAAGPVPLADQMAAVQAIRDSGVGTVLPEPMTPDGPTLGPPAGQPTGTTS